MIFQYIDGIKVLEKATDSDRGKRYKSIMELKKAWDIANAIGTVPVIDPVT